MKRKKTKKRRKLRIKCRSCGVRGKCRRFKTAVKRPRWLWQCLNCGAQFTWRRGLKTWC